MAVLWILLWSVIPCPVLLCGHCAVQQSSSSPTDPSLLESLECYNDYRTKVHCRWRRQGNSDLQLWFQIGTSSSKLCVPSDAPDDPGFAHCTYETSLFSIGISHTLFFTKNQTLRLSSADPKPVALLQELRALPPVNLSSHEVGDGGRRLQWWSPYPSSSSLKLKYRLSYRAETDDHWTTVNLTETSVTLERPSLLEGRRYEARVQAHAGVGQWSNWSPAVTWTTKDNSVQFPRLHCVLDGEKEVLCSWEVSADLAPIISYQLRCRQNSTDRFEACCLSPRVTSDLSGKETYSCSLAVSGPERLQLDLLPERRAKTFQVYQHIQPSPPQHVKVKERNRNWLVEWTESASAADLRLSYQIRYYKTQEEQGSSVLLNISEGSTSVLILGDSLAPLQGYQVQSRCLVVPGEGSYYKGIPSEWTTPVMWTSKEAFWSISTLIYIVIAAIVVVVFLTLYCTLPAFQRKILLWKESLPSPEKSKILSEIMSPASQLVMQNEKTCICKVEHLDSVSTCSSEAPLWPSKTSEQRVDQNPECWSGDDVTCCADKMNGSDTSSMSFSGPYIFCQVSESTSNSVKTDHGDKETLMEVSPTTAFPHNVDSYVRLPNTGLSRSTEDLAFHSNPNSEWFQHAEQHQHLSDTTLWHVQSNQQLISSPPPEYTASPFCPWPEEGTIPQSGYCHLPAAFMTATK